MGADCVFLPERLRDHLSGLRPPKDTPIYVKNNHLEGLGNSGFLGAIEVFSREAMKRYMDSADECGKSWAQTRGKMDSSKDAWTQLVSASSGTWACSNPTMTPRHARMEGMLPTIQSNILLIGSAAGSLPHSRC